MNGFGSDKSMATWPQNARGGSAPASGAGHRVRHDAYPATPPTPHSLGVRTQTEKKPQPNTQLTKKFSIRLTIAEDESLKTLAKWWGAKTRSGVVRKLVREAIGQGPDLLIRDLEIFREAVRQLGSLGRNMNQIARALNSNPANIQVIDRELMVVVRNQTETVQKELLAVIERSKRRWVRNVG